MNTFASGWCHQCFLIILKALHILMTIITMVTWHLAIAAWLEGVARDWWILDPLIASKIFKRWLNGIFSPFLFCFPRRFWCLTGKTENFALTSCLTECILLQSLFYWLSSVCGSSEVGLPDHLKLLSWKVVSIYELTETLFVSAITTDSIAS